MVANRSGSITFLNVNELAEYRRRLSERDFSVPGGSQNNNNHNIGMASKTSHSEDELAAALGLLMLRYQQEPKLIASAPPQSDERGESTRRQSTPVLVTPTDRPVWPLEQQQREDVDKAPLSARRSRRQPTRSGGETNKLSIKMKQQTPSALLANSSMPTMKQQAAGKSFFGSKSSSLLTSCRNILKEFLSQNSLQ